MVFRQDVEKTLPKIRRPNRNPAHRLPFGSAASPGGFCITSETLFDQENDLICCEEWYPLVLPYPYTQKIPNTLRLDNDAAFGAAEEADVKMDPHRKGGSDG